MSTYLTTEQVCGRLAAAGVDNATVGKVFAARLEPENLEDADKKFVMGVMSGKQVYFVLYQFGLGRPMVKADPLDEGGPDWRPRWLSIEGPFTFADSDEANAKARELTSG